MNYLLRMPAGGSPFAIENDSMNVLLLNSFSSSVKYKLY